MDKRTLNKINKLNTIIVGIISDARKILNDMVFKANMEEIPFYEIYDNGYNNHNFLKILSNGNGIVLQLDYIIYKNGEIKFLLADEEQDNETIKTLWDFNAEELLWIIDGLRFYFNMHKPTTCELLEEMFG